MSRLIKCTTCDELADGWLRSPTGENVAFCFICEDHLDELLEVTP